MIRMPIASVVDPSNGSSRATRHLLIRARSASGPVARGGHVTSSGSQPRVCQRPARTLVLPTPRVPDGLTITRFLEEARDTNGAEIIMPDNGMAEAFVKTLKRDYARVSPRPNAASVLRQFDSWFE